MEEGDERNRGIEKPQKQEFFSRVVRAGRRTYFFDVRATQGNDFYITIAESKKTIGHDGRLYFEKHKIFLYPEDFDAFSKGFSLITSYIRNSGRKIQTPHKLVRHEVSKETDNTIPEFEESEQPVESFSDIDLEFDNLSSTK